MAAAGDGAAWDATLALVRWKQTRKGFDGDAELLQTGFELLTQVQSSTALPPALAKAEATLNVPWLRIVSETVHFAIFLISRAKSGQHVHQTRNALRLLQLALTVLESQAQSDVVGIPMNACGQVLSAMADVLEQPQAADNNISDEESELRDVKRVFLHLFGLPATFQAHANAAAPTFQLYKPPTNVFSAFMQRSITACLDRLMRSEAGAESTPQYVELVHMIVLVFHELQRTQTNRKKVFLTVAKTSLRELIGHRYALVRLQHIEGIAGVVDLLDRILSDALFGADHIREYDATLVHSAVWQKSPGAQGRTVGKKHKKNEGGASVGLVSYQRNLFDEIKNFLSDAEVSKDLKISVGGFMEALVRGFSVRIREAAHTKIEETKTDLKTSRKRTATVIATTSTIYSPFKFWSELCAVAFLSLKNTPESGDAASAEELEVLVQVYNALFRSLCECDVYRVTEDTDEREQFKTMETILSSFIELIQGCTTSKTLHVSMIHAQCDILSNAVRCSPNLVNDSLVSILELLGTHAAGTATAKKKHEEKARLVLQHTSECLVNILRAYESMRLLDTLFTSSFSMKASQPLAPQGLYQLFSSPTCDPMLRRSLMTLPPGQLDVLWTLFTTHMVSKSADSTEAYALALARLLFQTFLQEIHVTPQNRTKVTALVANTHEQLLLPLGDRLKPKKAGKSVKVSPNDQEILSLFGELLLFYEVIGPTARAETMDLLLSAFHGDACVSLTQKLLQNDKAKKQEASKIGRDAGIIKICVHWLRHPSAAQQAGIGQSRMVRLTSLVLDHVIACKYWDAVGFYLPDVMANASESHARSFFDQLLRAYVQEEIDGVTDGSAGRIVREAAFYEIMRLRSVAPSVLAVIVSELTSNDETSFLFAYLSSLPRGYLDVQGSADLLVNALSAYKATTNSSGTKEARLAIITWLQIEFSPIAVAVARTDAKVQVAVRAAATMFFKVSASAGDSVVSTVFLCELLGFYSDDPAVVTELLGSVIEARRSPSENLAGCVPVVEALAKLHISKRVHDQAVRNAETALLSKIHALVKKEMLFARFDSELSFQALTALVNYHVSSSEALVRNKQLSTSTETQTFLDALPTYLGAALGASMKLIMTTESSANQCAQAAWSFYSNLCETYPKCRPAVSLEGYGCMLAVALCLTGREKNHAFASEQPLQALVVNANKTEFSLLLSTVVKELRSSELFRVIPALRALALVLSADKKLSTARRQMLSDSKNVVIGLLINNLHRSSASESDKRQNELCIANLHVFVLYFTKAELFTWKTHELTHALIGFQPLLNVTAQWDRHSASFTTSQLHQLWMLSYTLLLRIVRHHFASLVNGMPQLVQATNALLEMLVRASAGCSASELPQFLEWSSNLSRLHGYFKEHGPQLRKHVVYLMMTYLLGVTRDQLAVSLQQKLRPGIFALMDICSLFEKEQLYAALDSTGKSLLKTLDTTYKLTHRYVGKV